MSALNLPRPYVDKGSPQVLLLAIVAALSSLKPNLQRQTYFDQYELNVAGVRLPERIRHW